jgi:spoIIIJ-associated protein
MKTRRFFAGSTLPQALMAGARYHGLSPDELAYRLRDKRHGFVTRTRRFIVEIDPAAPRRSGYEERAAAPVAMRPEPPAAAPQSPRGGEMPPVAARPADAPAAGPRPQTAPRRAAPASHVEPFLPPDEESEMAASVAVGRLLTLARLDLTVRVERQPDRLLISLGGPDEVLLRELGEEFLDDMEHLAPRAIRGLAGRMVRCKVEGAGLRSAHEDELRSLAERVAAEVVASGAAALLEPLSAADRRIVHLALVDDPRVTTESQGLGAEKRIQISPAAPSGTPFAAR